MMKVLVLMSCFLLVFTSSLVSAGFFTPSPDKQQHSKDVKEVHAGGGEGVVIDLETHDDGNTKVFISPQDQKGYAENAKDKLSQTMEAAKDKIVGGNKHDTDVQHEDDHHDDDHSKFSARELVCDAYGKCKHKIASVMGRTQDVASDKVGDSAEGAKDVIGKVKDTVTGTANKAYDKAQEMKESMEDKAKEKASEMKQGSMEKAEKGAYNAKDKAYQMTEEAKKAMGEGISKAKDTVSGTAKKAADVAYETKQSAEGSKEKLIRQVSTVREKANKAKAWMGTMTGVLHLVGLSAAYGMSLWVTFGSSYVLAGALPRQQFGMVQSKIFPLYFKAMAFSLGMGLLGHLLSGKRTVVSPLSMAAALGMTLVNLFYLEPRASKVMFERMKKEKEEGRGKESSYESTEPSTDITPEETSTAGRKGTTTETVVVKGPTGGVATTTEGEKPQGAKTATAKSRVIRGSKEILQRVNSYSSVLNVLTLMSLTWHLVHLAHHLHTCC